MPKKRLYIKPHISEIKIDKEISLIMMTYGDEDNPPPDPFGAAAPAPNPFEENPFQEKKE
jgi:hypothetical protein